MLHFENKFQKIGAALAVLLALPSLHGSGILGGGESPDPNVNIPYVTIVDDAGVATSITGEVPALNGEIITVKRNPSGAGLIGGRDNWPGSDRNSADPYAAIISPSGVATKITGDVPVNPGLIYSVDLNDSGMGVIGGQHQNPSDTYVALVSPTGVASLLTGGGLPVPRGSIRSVAINNSGAGIIGGTEDTGNAAYAAIFSPSGVTTAISGAGVPVGLGTIEAVAVNENGAALIGGNDNGKVDAYAAVVSPTGVTTEVSGPNAPAPGGSGNIGTVAINNDGNGLIGGRDNAGDAYASLVSATGNATAISGFNPTAGGTILSVDLNDSGVGIIAGAQNANNDPYGVVVSPSGTATLITGEVAPSNSFYFAAAISESGVGILGGIDTNQAESLYAAIVSPTGIATKITGDLGNTFGQVAAADFVDDIINLIDPGSVGPGNTFASGVTALSSNVLPSHIRKMPERKGEPETAMLTADATDRIRQPQGCERANYAFWLAPFGLFATYDKVNSFPKMKEWSVGGMIGYDYLGWDNMVVGGGGAYSFQRVDYKSRGGHADIHQELLTLYVGWQTTHFTIDGALWGGIYQMHNKRKTLGSITSTSNVNGGILAPHLGMSAPFKINNTILTVEPYVMFDWVNNWQGSIKEKGSSGLNLRIDSQYVSLLRSEVGLTLMQLLHYPQGDLTFEESGSYVNRTPFHAKKQDAYYVGSVSTFSVQVFNNKSENLGALRLSCRFVPCNMDYQYIALTYLGEFGANLILNTVALEVGKRF